MSNNNPVNDMTSPVSCLINDLDKVIKAKPKLKVIKTTKIRQLFSKHRVSKIVSSGWWRWVQTEKM